MSRSRTYLSAIKKDQGAMLQLTPESMDLMVAGFEDRSGVAYQHRERDAEGRRHHERTARSHVRRSDHEHELMTGEQGKNKKALPPMTVVTHLLSALAGATGAGILGA